MGVEVVFPNELLVALKEDNESFRRKVLVYTLGKLYETGRISGGLGARILGCDHWEFYRLLSENGFAVIDYPDEELEREADTSRELARDPITVAKVIVNSTPLIALSQVGRLSLLKLIFDEVVVPASVYNEVVIRGKNRPGAAELRDADWIIVKAIPFPNALWS